MKFIAKWSHIASYASFSEKPQRAFDFVQLLVTVHIAQLRYYGDNLIRYPISVMVVPSNELNLSYWSWVYISATAMSLLRQELRHHGAESLEKKHRVGVGEVLLHRFGTACHHRAHDILHLRVLEHLHHLGTGAQRSQHLG